MKTREQILESIHQWYGMGAEMVSIKEDKAAKSIMMRPGMWTNHSQAAICGENDYTIIISSEGIYPTPRYGLLVMIYYEAQELRTGGGAPAPPQAAPANEEANTA